MSGESKPTIEVTIAYENGEADIYLCEDFTTGGVGQLISRPDDGWISARVRESEYSTVELHIERRGLNYIRKRTVTPKPQGLPS